MKQTSYSLLLALAVACETVDARELQLSYSDSSEDRFIKFMNYTLFLRDSNTPAAADPKL